jgi:hypothetical protein
VIDGAKVLALTALDVWADGALRARIATEFAAIGGVPDGVL